VEAESNRKLLISVPDLGDAQKNRELDRLMSEIVARIVRLMGGT
jgi:hypothetical protein